MVFERGVNFGRGAYGFIHQPHTFIGRTDGRVVHRRAFAVGGFGRRCSHDFGCGLDDLGRLSLQALALSWGECRVNLPYNGRIN